MAQRRRVNQFIIDSFDGRRHPAMTNRPVDRCKTVESDQEGRCRGTRRSEKWRDRLIPQLWRIALIRQIGFRRIVVPVDEEVDVPSNRMI